MIGHIDKFEVEELEDEQKGEAEGGAVVAAEGDDIRGDETVGTGEAGEARERTRQIKPIKEKKWLLKKMKTQGRSHK